MRLANENHFILFFLAILAFIIYMAGCHGGDKSRDDIDVDRQERSSVIDFLSKGSLHGNWLKKGEPRSYTAENLYLFNNGESVNFTSYDLDNMSHFEYSRGEEILSIEVYRFKNPSGAFGVYSLYRAPKLALSFNFAHICLNGRGINLLKGSYYMVMIIDPWQKKYQGEVIALARLIAENIPEDTVIPKVVLNLPKEELVQRSQVYIESINILLNFYPWVSKDIFGFEEGTVAALASYRRSKDKYFIINIEFPSAKQASKAFGELKKVIKDNETFANKKFSNTLITYTNREKVSRIKYIPPNRILIYDSMPILEQ